MPSFKAGQIVWLKEMPAAWDGHPATPANPRQRAEVLEDYDDDSVEGPFVMVRIFEEYRNEGDRDGLCDCPIDQIE